MKYFLAYTLSITFLIHVSGSYGQSFNFEIKPGYASYSMRDLKRMLQEAETPSFKLVNNFPPFYTFGAAGLYKIDNLESGIEIGYYTTGGKLHYQDYSGETGVEILTSAYSIGILEKYTILKFKKLDLKASVSLDFYFSNMSLKIYTYTSSLTSSTSDEFVSKSIVVGPAIEPVYHFSKIFYVGAKLGLAADTSGKLHLKGDKNAKLVNDKDESVTTDWSGFRLEAYVGIRFDLEDNY